MNIAELFGLKKAEPQQPQQQPQQQTQPQQPSGPGFEQSANNKMDAKMQSPMDAFADLFKTEPADPNKPQQPDPNAPFFALDPKKLSEQIANTDFLPQDNFDEVVQSAFGPNVDSAAVRQLLNMTAKQAYLRGAELSTNVANRVTKTGLERSQGDISAKVKEFMADDNLLGSSDILKHAAVEPVAKAIRQQIMAKNPNATPQEISAQTQNYLKSFAQLFTQPQQDKQQTQQQRQAASSTDFSNFFD